MNIPDLWEIYCARVVMWESQLYVLLLGSLLPLMMAAPLQPGQPGAPWTEEEVEVTREKVKTQMP